MLHVGRHGGSAGSRQCGGGIAGPQLQPSVQLRTRDDFEAATGAKAPAGKRYFKHRHLPDIINEYPVRSDLSEAEVPACPSSPLHRLIELLSRDMLGYLALC